MKFVVTTEEKTKRLDVFITDNSKDLNRSYAGKLCDDGKVKVNGEVKPASYKVKKGDKISIGIDLKKLKHVPKIDLPIIYEDDDVIVISKPEGVLTHSKGAFNPEATVASFIKDKVHFPQSNEPNDRDGIVHRLDRATSGVIICAKNPAALTWLQKQFSSRRAKKTYIAVVSGQLEPKEAIIDMPIARNPKNPKTFYVSPNGKKAITHYRIVKELSDDSLLLQLQPETGRTHQLRVHMAYLGHPIVGDTLYKGRDNERMLLHANKLEITLPSKETREFVAEVPSSFHNVS